MKVRTAIHAAIWSTDPKPEVLGRTLRGAASAGFDCVALPLRDPARIIPSQVAAAFQAAGLGAIGTAGVPPHSDPGSPDADARARGRDHLELAVALARDCGMTQINGILYGPLGRAAGPVSDDTIQRSADTLHHVAEIAETSGIRLCIELVNRYETALLNTVESGLTYLADAGHANLHLHLDTFHMSIEEADVPSAVLRALPRLGYFELDQSHRGRLDQGSLDLAAMSAPLVAAGYDGLVGVEAFARSRLADDHANALAIWRNHFDDADGFACNAMDMIRNIFGRRPVA
nr:sugar phosphate isomerase/epimerase family protein [Pseudotabrizicola algicola]